MLFIHGTCMNTRGDEVGSCLAHNYRERAQVQGFSLLQKTLSSILGQRVATDNTKLGEASHKEKVRRKRKRSKRKKKKTRRAAAFTAIVQSNRTAGPAY